LPATQVHIQNLRAVLNEGQVAALISAFTLGDSHVDIMSLIVGPPGTGKTLVSAHIAAHCRRQGATILVVCASNHGLDVIAERIIKEFTSSKSPITVNGLYRLDREFGEGHEMQMPTDYRQQRFKDAQLFTDDVIKELVTLDINPSLFQALRSWIETKSSTNNRLSLGRHIISRLERAVAQGPNWPQDRAEDQEEFTLLWELMTWQRALAREGQVFAEPLDLPDHLASLEALEEDNLAIHDVLVRGLRNAWTCLQHFYIDRAKIVLCTASTAGRKMLRYF
jgi:AAA domain